MNNIVDLQDVIRELHGAESTHRESVPVKEIYRGEPVWDGMVEIFNLHGHPETDTAYAWSQETGDPAMPTKYFTVLHVPPVFSPLTAVRALIMQESDHAKRAEA